MILQRVVQIRDVSLMMLPVMNLHRLRVDVRFKRGEVVRELGQFMRHADLLVKPASYYRGIGYLGLCVALLG